MNLNAEDYRVIAWFAEKHNLIPQLSSKPNISFKTKDGADRIVKHHLTTMEMEYIAYEKTTKSDSARRVNRKRKPAT